MYVVVMVVVDVDVDVDVVQTQTEICMLVDLCIFLWGVDVGCMRALISPVDRG
jgi:hypothetical protein